MATSEQPQLTPEQLQALVGPDVDRGPALMALFLTLSIVTLFVTLGRCMIRLRARNIGTDDGFALIASILFIGIAICVSIGATGRTYRHVEYLMPDQINLSILLNTIEQTFLSTAESFGKIAIALTILRILPATAHKAHKIFLWALIALTAATGIAMAVVPWTQCQDRKAVWDITLRPYTTCWSVETESAIIMYHSCWHVVTDFLLALYPTVLLWNIKISLGRKVALCILLGLGCLTGIFSAIKTNYGNVLVTALDATFDQYYLQIFAGLELFCLLVLASAPVYKAPFKQLTTRIAASDVVSSARGLLGTRSTRSGGNSTNKGSYIKHTDPNSSGDFHGDTAMLTSGNHGITYKTDYIVESYPMTSNNPKRNNMV